MSNNNNTTIQPIAFGTGGSSFNTNKSELYLIINRKTAITSLYKIIDKNKISILNKKCEYLSHDKNIILEHEFGGLSNLKNKDILINNNIIYFTSIRNPYDRFVSGYKMLKEQNYFKNNISIMDVAIFIYNIYNTELTKRIFNKSCHCKICNNDYLFKNFNIIFNKHITYQNYSQHFIGHIAPQYNIIRPDLIASNIHYIRFENFDNECKIFFNNKNLQCFKERISKDKLNYKEFYKKYPELKDLIYKIYEKDFTTFNYDNIII
tara:strand:- start:128 stop:919 length:792 start_codon:yes stop_codon:yes gene_type:complete